MRLTWMFIGVVATILLAAGAGAEEIAESDETAVVESDSAMMEEMRDLYGDEAFVTIATGSKKPIFKAPAVATVITADEIKAMGARSLDDVLETVAGLHVVPSTQGRLDSIFSIRGIHTKYNPQVLVLMNGTPFPFFTGGRPFHFRLPVAVIERIEVIRGPGSAIYGADAYAGVINVTTKESADINGAEAGGRVGSFDTHDTWIQYGKTINDWEIAFSLEWQKSDGDRGRRIKSDFQTILDERFQTTASLAPGPLDTRYNVLDIHADVKRGDWRLRHWYWGQEDAGLGAGSSLALDPKGGEDLKQHLFDLSYKKDGFLRGWDLGANVNFLYFENNSSFVLLPPRTSVPIGPDGNLDFTSNSLVSFPNGLLGDTRAVQESLGFELTGIYTGIDSHRLRLGSGFRHSGIKVKEENKNFGPGVIDGTIPTVDGALTDVSSTSNVFMPDKSRKIFYALMQDEWQLKPDLEIVAGVRIDHYSDFGETVNPRLALVWAPQYNFTAKLLYGRAFRAPSFSEQFTINNPVGLGNKNLKPEEINTIEIVFDYRPTYDFQTNASFFGYRADDLIDFLPDSEGNRVAQNARDQMGYGFELEGIWDAKEGLRLRGNYAWQYSKERETGKRIPDAPGQKFFLSADWQFLPNWSVHPQFIWVGSRKRSAEDPRSPVDDYWLVNMALHRKDLVKNMDLALTARNLFNEDAREPSSGPQAPGLPVSIPNDYPLEGRSLLGEIRYHF